MNVRKWNTFAFGAAAAMLMSACENSSTSPTTSTEARADLKVMAANVKYLARPNTDKATGGGLPFKKGAGKISAAAAACDQEAIWYDKGTDTTDYGLVSIYSDTTTSYTAADLPICAANDVVSYEVTNSLSKDAVLESWTSTRNPVSADFFSDTLNGTFTMTGHGWVHYLDGYKLTIESMNVAFNFKSGFTAFGMNLALENGYTVALTLAPGVNLMSQTPPAPTSVMMSGPIVKGGTTVGYFEVLANDGVVIRDAGKAVIDSHG